MGRVFRGYDSKLHRWVAIKLLRADSFPSGSEALARVLHEARLAAPIDHPGVVSIYDVGEDPSGPFIVMEFVAGRSLRELIDASGITLAERLRWLIEVARVLAATHRLGLVHRDIKPENVMIRTDGSVKLLDFGIALRLPGPGRDPRDESSEIGPAGTPRYMAPEQIQRRRIDARTDQFAWGVVAYELLGGVLPWRSLDDGVATAIAIVTERQVELSRVVLDVPPRLAQIIDRALEKAPARRFASMNELLAELESVVVEPTTEQPRLRSTTSKPSETRAETRAPRRRSSPMLRWGLALAVLGATTTVAVLAGSRESESARAVEAEPAWTPAPAAQAAYDEGLRRFEGAALNAAIQQFALAVEYEPEFAAAHLRLGFILMADGPHPVGTESLHTATRLRRRLDGRDQLLLDALGPAFTRDPPALDEAARRLELLADLYSSDVELRLIYAITLSLDGHDEAAAAHYRALLDDRIPVATAWLALAYTHGREHRLDAALDAVSRCVELSPDAIDCIWYRTRLDAFAGRCDAMAAGASKWIELGPTDHSAPLTLIQALVAQDAEPERIEQAVAEARARMTVAQQVVSLGLIAARRSILAGRFDDADRLLAELPDAVELDARELVGVGELRVALHEEIGDIAGASAIAADHLRRKASLLGEGYDGEDDITHDPTPWLNAIRLAAGELDRDEFERRRQAWLAGWRARVGTEFEDLLWLRGYADTARTPTDAHQALAERAKLEISLRFVTDRLFVVDRARVYLLAGQPEQAAALLREAVRSCLVLAEPLRFVQAHELLGRALEALGDRDGACLAYRAVLERWGQATPSSRTAIAAAQRFEQLACGA